MYFFVIRQAIPSCLDTFKNKRSDNRENYEFGSAFKDALKLVNQGKKGVILYSEVITGYHSYTIGAITSEKQLNDWVQNYRKKGTPRHYTSYYSQWLEFYCTFSSICINNLIICKNCSIISKIVHYPCTYRRGTYNLDLLATDRVNCAASTHG
jgi:hypothetical protein